MIRGKICNRHLMKQKQEVENVGSALRSKRIEHLTKKYENVRIFKWKLHFILI